MCRTCQSCLQALSCSMQMLIRIFMTFLLMVENLIRMLMQTFYNCCSFIMQMLSLLPICLVFLLSSRLKCFMCCGSGPCPANRGGLCDCVMSAIALIIIFFIFRATGILDKVFYSLGYEKAQPIIYTRILPTPAALTDCSRTDSVITDTTTELSTITDFVYVSDYWYMTSSTVASTPEPEIEWQTQDLKTSEYEYFPLTDKTSWLKGSPSEPMPPGREGETVTVQDHTAPPNVVYYLM